MSKKLSVIICVCLLSTIMLPAQEINDTIYYDSEHRQVKQFDSTGFFRVITIDDKAGFQFYVRDYYPTGQLMMSGQYRSLNPDNKNGEFNYFYSSGMQKKKCSYKDNQLNGKYLTWYDNGTIKQKSTYNNNKLDGLTKIWSEEGVLRKYVEYKNGKINGKLISYYSDGQETRNELYKNDSLIKSMCYSPTGADTIYFKHFTPPQFLGGDITKFSKWVLIKLRYPLEAKEKKEEGEVGIKFTVSRTGKVGTVQIIKQDKTYFNSEVLRVINNSPLWSPAMRDLDTISITFQLPVKFTLPEK